MNYRDIRPYLRKGKGVLSNIAKFTEKTVSESLLMKLQTSGLQCYQKMRLWSRYFPVNFPKLLRGASLKNISRRQLLIYFSKEYIAGQSDIPRLSLRILLFSINFSIFHFFISCHLSFTSHFSWTVIWKYDFER